MFNIEKHKLEKINVIKNDKANILILSFLVFGSIIATSYFALAITPNIEHMLTYKPYNPKSSGVKYCVRIGVMMIGMNCAIEMLVMSFRVFL
tara:strand:+ start:331 stop:606 length:276 start_codon:yes stop_codon:yes gene_type:complete